MARKKLLFIIDRAPLPINSGQNVRIRGLTAACRRIADVTLIAPRPASADDCRQVEADFARVVWIDDERAAGFWDSALCVAKTAHRAGGAPIASKIARFMPYVRAIERANPARFDMIWAERPHIGRLCGEFGYKTIVDLDDLEHIKIRRQMALVRSAPEKMKLAYRYLYSRRLELIWTRKLFAIVVCSLEDSDYLARHGCVNALVVPNGAGLPVEAQRIQPTHGPDPRLLFLGNLAYGPNVDALEFLAADILPELLRDAPGATLDVIGANAPENFSGGAAMQFRGYVDDLAAAAGDYDMLIAPLRYGGGTKIKVLDAMTQGLPVITTGVGAEGLGLTHGVDVWLAETPSEFVEGVLRLKRDPEFSARLAANARERVAEYFIWPAIETRLANWLDSARPPQSAGSRPTAVRHLPRGSIAADKA